MLSSHSHICGRSTPHSVAKGKKHCFLLLTTVGIHMKDEEETKKDVYRIMGICDIGKEATIIRKF